MRAYVPLPTGLSARDWARRHSLDEVPDASPYGLHRLADYGSRSVLASLSWVRGPLELRVPCGTG